MIAMGRVAWEDELLSNSYVNELGATVWIYDDGPGGTDLVSGHTYTTMSKYLNEFIEDAIPGGVDCVVGFCHMAEYIARAAALRPDLAQRGPRQHGHSGDVLRRTLGYAPSLKASTKCGSRRTPQSTLFSSST